MEGRQNETMDCRRILERLQSIAYHTHGSGIFYIAELGPCSLMNSMCSLPIRAMDCSKRKSDQNTVAPRWIWYTRNIDGADITRIPQIPLTTQKKLLSIVTLMLNRWSTGLHRKPASGGYLVNTERIQATFRALICHWFAYQALRYFPGNQVDGLAMDALGGCLTNLDQNIRIRMAASF